MYILILHIDNFLNAMRLELRAVSKSADLELGGNLVEDTVGVDLGELLGSVLARILQEDLLATGVLVKELGYIIDIALDNHPGRFLCREYIINVPVLCLATSARVKVGIEKLPVGRAHTFIHFVPRPMMRYALVKLVT